MENKNIKMEAENIMFSDIQFKTIQELNPTFPVFQDASKMSTDDLDELYEIAEDESLSKGGLAEDNINNYGRIMESIMDFIEDNFPQLFLH